ncbi:MAG TPA: 23S rRNA (guanosine(2251)-2'-O)-methyltransferase RlmB [Actinomycetota bacterium]|nr:23S rRNA (guanosine(2251)-2'-O)-methyltransferase RlmB [Actinomycetota bacterium]
MTAPPPDLVLGRHPVAEALRAGVAVRRLFLAEGMRPSPLLDEVVAAAERARVPVGFESRAALNRRAGAGNHQGVVAEVEPFSYHTLADLLAGPAHRLVLLEGITDPANLGSILRSAEAFGWHGVLIPEHRATGVTPTVRKVAAGAAERVPIVRTNSPAASVRLLQERHEFAVFGLDPAGTASYKEVEFPERVCLVVGAEGPGLSRLVRERCDRLVRIPMHGALASINAAVAAAIVMAEAALQ